MNPRGLIEKSARNHDIDDADGKSRLKPMAWVRDGEVLTSIAISLRRLADMMEQKRDSGS